MACDFKEEDGYILTTLYGRVTVSDLARLSERAHESEMSASPALHRLTDISRVEEVLLNFAEVDSYAAKRRLAKLGNNVRSAIVAKTPLQYGVARMFQTMNENPQIEVAIFPDADAALAWIRGTDKTSPKPPPSHTAEPHSPSRAGSP